MLVCFALVCVRPACAADPPLGEVSPSADANSAGPAGGDSNQITSVVPAGGDFNQTTSAVPAGGDSNHITSAVPAGRDSNQIISAIRVEGNVSVNASEVLTKVRTRQGDIFNPGVAADRKSVV